MLDALDPTKPITLDIDSGGGSVFAGLRIYNAMIEAKVHVNTYCNSMAASMAAVLFAAGDHRTVGNGCQFLIHQIAAGTQGKMKNMEDDMTNFAAIQTKLLEILVENSGLSHEILREMFKYDLYYNAAEIMEMGFADEVSGDKPRHHKAGDRNIREALRPENRKRLQIMETLGSSPLSPQP